MKFLLQILVLVLIQIVGMGVPARARLEPGAPGPGALTQQQGDDLRRQLGTIIVTPGSGPALAVADFQPRASGVGTSIATFNEVLWNDLKFAGAANLVGKSLYPKTLVADPSALQVSDWAGEPVKADYVAFGNLTGNSDAQGFLFEVKTQ
jgi:hypothetical protein